MVSDKKSARFSSPLLHELELCSPPPGEALTACARLFDAILATEWEIYVRPYLNGLKPDLVLVNPNVGVAVFQVVDQECRDLDTAPSDAGDEAVDSINIHRAPSAARWLQRAHLCKQEILESYLPGLNAYGPTSFSYAAVTSGLIFPGLSRVDVTTLVAQNGAKKRSALEQQYGPLVAAEDLESRDLARIFPEGARKASKLMNEGAAQKLRSWLLEPEYRREQRKPLVLDQRQREIAGRRTQTGYQRLRGPAGSGKTAVLAAKAARLEAEGKRSLILVYNLTLVNYMRDMVDRARMAFPSCPQSIEIMSFHAWCRRICCENGFADKYKALWVAAEENDPNQASDAREQVLKDRLAEMVEEILVRFGEEDSFVGARYDALLVDEGQDFRLSWWNCARQAVCADGERVLCADMTQDLYQTAKLWTNEAMEGAGFRGLWNELKVAYRLPEGLVPYARDFAERFLPEELRDLPELPPYTMSLGHELHLRWNQVSPAELVSTAKNAVLDMPDQSDPADVSFSDVVLIADDRSTGDMVVGELLNHKVNVFHTFHPEDRACRLAKAGFYMSDCSVKATTIHSFKGLESRYLVICISRARKPKELAALYIAMTRLKASSFGNSHLTVVCADPSLEAYGLTWPSLLNRSGSEEVNS